MGSFYARNAAGDLLARYSFLEPLLEGKRVLEIGAARATDGGSALFLAERTVASHLTHIYAKLGVRSRTELARRLQ